MKTIIAKAYAMSIPFVKVITEERFRIELEKAVKYGIQYEKGVKG